VAGIIRRRTAVPELLARACYAFGIVPNVEPNAAILFYDGHCGMCNHAVTFVLKHDRSGRAFRFAPLQGTTFPSRVSAEERARLPNSIVVLTEEGATLTRSDASIYVFRRLGGRWKTLGDALAMIPRPLRDFVYDFIARIRYRIFGRRDELCPIMPPELRARFDP
jgi:predicted DCC family thiol-disulfide oxidoreductase YuxK